MGDVIQTARTPALPAKAMWFFVIGPPVLAFLFDPACVKEPGHLARAMVAIVSYTVLTGLSVHYSFEWLHRRIGQMHGAARLILHALVTTLVVAVVSLPQVLLVRVVYPEAIGDELTIVSRGVLVSFTYLAVASFIGYLQRQAARERTRAQEERVAALESRLRLLQAQTQPHFLFNSLNVCAGLVHADADSAEKTLDKLAEFLRYSLESTERRLVPLEEELEAVRYYLEVQRQRFGERLQFDVSSTADRRLVPPMLLQPLVENAILHGIQCFERGGSVTVEASVDDGDLVIDVIDAGTGPRASSHSGTGVGQKNIRERLDLVYGPEARLVAGPTDSGGYCSTITIPAAP